MNHSKIIAAHNEWLRDNTKGACANLRDANLRGADLWEANLACANLLGANLADANLAGAIGNMREMRSAQFETWPVTIIAGTMQIGCQRHSLDLWRKSDPRWIATLDRNATEWWQKWGDVCLKLAEGM